MPSATRSLDGTRGQFATPVDAAGWTTLEDKSESICQKGEQEHELEISRMMKCILLVCFSFAQFLDTFNVSALVTAIPAVTSRLDFKPSETVWLFSAYQLTFAAFMLPVRPFHRDRVLHADTDL
jgi:hypothetical protein